MALNKSVVPVTLFKNWIKFVSFHMDLLAGKTFYHRGTQHEKQIELFIKCCCWAMVYPSTYLVIWTFRATNCSFAFDLTFRHFVALKEDERMRKAWYNSGNTSKLPVPFLGDTWFMWWSEPPGISATLWWNRPFDFWEDWAGRFSPCKIFFRAGIRCWTHPWVENFAM